ncbi:MAG: hypothetical protein K6A44_07535 [bacterium]|nr:hypothetical protein [bacterium]
MQVNSVNNQNSFGLTFSPRFKNELRKVAIEVFSAAEDEAKIYKYTPKVRDTFEKRVLKLKEMMPGAKLDIADSWEYGDSHISNYIGNFTHTARIPCPSKDVVLKRKDMPDTILGPLNEFNYHLGVLSLIRRLEGIKLQEQESPALMAAIERTKKLLS